MENDTLPAGWTWANLGDLGEFINGKAFKPGDWKSKGRPIIRIQNLTGSTDKTHYFDGSIEEKYIVRPGDVLVSWSATLDAFLWNGPEAVLNQHIFKVRPFTDKAFLYYLIKSYLGSLRAQVHGTGMQHITKGRFDKTRVLLPPLLEQKRIAWKIEELLYELRIAKQALQKVPAIMKQFRQSVLAAAFRGELTRRPSVFEPTNDLRGETDQKGEADEAIPNGHPFELPDGWTWVTLGQIADAKGGVTKGRKFNGKRTVKMPYLRVANVQAGYLDLVVIKQIEVRPEEVEEYTLRSGDILFTEGGDRDKLGRGTVWRDEIPNCLHQNHIFRARLNSHEVSSEYVSLYSQSVFARDYFFSVASQTVNLASINITHLRALPIPLATSTEQRQIVSKVRILFDHADIVTRTLRVATLSVEQSESSILAKAFHGELVPQDSKDEPASVLLERIRKQRELSA